MHRAELRVRPGGRQRDHHPHQRAQQRELHVRRDALLPEAAHRAQRAGDGLGLGAERAHDDHGLRGHVRAVQTAAAAQPVPRHEAAQDHLEHTEDRAVRGDLRDRNVDRG